MSSASPPPADSHAQPGTRALPGAVRALLVLVALFVFASAVTLMGSSFKLVGREAAGAILAWASNPVMGLFVGILMTAVVQSSSTVTAMIVTAVAGGAVPVPVAVPMVMGANIGTTVTNTLVALGSVVRSDEFRRSLQAATVHDFFNYLTVLLLLPLEIALQATGLLRSTDGRSVGLLGFLGDRTATLALGLGTPVGVEETGGVGFLFKAPAQWVLDVLTRVLSGGDHVTAKALAAAASESSEPGRLLLLVGLAGAVTGLALLSICLILISRNMRVLVLGRFEGALAVRVLESPATCIVLGVVLTIMVQSSSITTSILVPLAAAGLVRLRQVFHVTLGANLGTTFTGLLAALFLVTAGDAGARYGLAIAVVHVLFNVFGITIVLSVPWLRELPLRVARRFAETCMRRRAWAVAYLLGVFFGLPGVFLLLQRALQALLG